MALAALASALTGCAGGDNTGTRRSGDDVGTGDNQGGGNPNPGSGGNGGNGGVPSGPTFVTDPGDAETVDPTKACATSTFQGSSAPLDMFIMFDQSASMNSAVNGGSRWSVVKAALSTFFKDPKSAGLGAGIGYFPVSGSLGPKPSTCDSMHYCPGQPAGPGAANDGAWKGTCDTSAYSGPDVEIGILNDASHNLIASLNAHVPGGDTPTSAALTGALAHAKSWAMSHPDRKVIVVLATDGIPTGCDASIPNIANIAAQAVSGTPSIKTFVIGVGSSLSTLNAIAAGGGTKQALIVDTAGTNPGQEFLDHLNEIRGNALGCAFTLPASDAGTVDYAHVNVKFTPPGGTETIIGNVANASSCDANAGGWFYDDPASPKTITLCPTSCDTVTAAKLSGTIDLVLGCETVKVTPK